MAGYRLFPVDHAVFICFLNSTFSNAIFPYHIGTLLVGINAGGGIVTFKIGYISAVLFNGLYTLSGHKGSYFGVDLVQDMQLIMVQWRTRIPFNATGALAFTQIADKVFLNYVLMHQNIANLDHICLNR